MIRCEGLTKLYPRNVERRRSLRAVVAVRARRPFASADGECFTALDDFSADFRAGEVTGIVGGNGAGKSTLLKILSRITRPTAGRAEIDGRVGSLLEAGAGFHPELTGRENVYFQGAILGMRRAEIDARFDEIVEFSGVQAALDVPVKRFSSGMYVRLAFAVGAHLDTEVLLVDEVLAVGDVAFQRRCLHKMREVTASGRTVLFVSHSLDSVRWLCPRTILLDDGRVVAHGPTDEVVARYVRDNSEAAPGDWIDLARVRRRGSGEARFSALRVVRQPVSNNPIEIEVEIVSRCDRIVPSLSAAIVDPSGTKLVNCDTMASGQRIALHDGVNRLRLRVASLPLSAGIFDVRLSLALSPSDPIDHIETATTIEVVDERVDTGSAWPPSEGVVAADYEWTALPRGGP